MTTQLYEWMRNLAVFYIFLSTVMHLAPSRQYGEYLRFFMGLLLILLMLSPLLQILRLKEVIAEQFQNYSIQNEAIELPEDLDDLEEAIRQKAEKKWEEVYGGEEGSMETSR